MKSVKEKFGIPVKQSIFLLFSCEIKEVEITSSSEPIAAENCSLNEESEDVNVNVEKTVIKDCSNNNESINTSINVELPIVVVSGSSS